MSRGYPVPSARATFGSGTVRLRLASVIESPWKRIVEPVRGCADSSMGSPIHAVPSAARAASTKSRRVRSSLIGPITSRSSSRSLQAHPVDQRLEPGIPLERIEEGIHRQVHEPATPLIESLLAPVEGLVDIAESDVDDRERDR